MKKYLLQINISSRAKYIRCALSSFIIASMVLAPLSYASAALSCSVTTSAACTGTIVMRMSNATNAHAELPSQSNLSYENAVVCCTSPSAISNSCSGNYKIVGRLSSPTNAHVQEEPVNTYGTDVCLSDATSGDTITIGYQDTDCAGYDTPLFSLSNSINATVGDANAYNRKVCGTITSTATPPPSDSGGGGSSGMLTGVLFSGIAYPGAVVHIWKDGAPRTTILSDERGYFSVRLDEIYTPSVLYTLYAVDPDGKQSLLLNYPVVVKSGVFTRVSDIRFAPTLSINKSQVKQNSSIVVSGYAAPNVTLQIHIEGTENRIFETESSPSGKYELTLELDGIAKGDYTLYIQSTDSPKSSTVLQFTIADTERENSTDALSSLPGDCNADHTINLVDFSVMAFWYDKSNPPKCVDTNNDGIINLTDFSILAYYWTE